MKVHIQIPPTTLRFGGALITIMLGILSLREAMTATQLAQEAHDRDSLWGRSVFPVQDGVRKAVGGWFPELGLRNHRHVHDAAFVRFRFAIEDEEQLARIRMIHPEEWAEAAPWTPAETSPDVVLRDGTWREGRYEFTEALQVTAPAGGVVTFRPTILDPRFDEGCTFTGEVFLLCDEGYYITFDETSIVNVLGDQTRDRLRSPLSDSQRLIRAAPVTDETGVTIHQVAKQQPPFDELAVDVVERAGADASTRSSHVASDLSVETSRSPASLTIRGTGSRRGRHSTLKRVRL